MQKIKKGDMVRVNTGKDKGMTGEVLQVITPSTTSKKKVATRVLVKGINLVTKHVRANPALEQAGGIIKKEASLDISNVAILNQKTGKADKIAFKILENEKRRVRVFKSTGEVVDV